MTFALFVDRKQRVLVARLGTVVTAPALTAMRAAARRFVACEGPCRAIVDFSAVERAEVPSHVVADLAEEGPVIQGEMRVLVAPKPEVFGLSRMYEMIQYRTAERTRVVRSFDEPYAALEIADLELAPVEDS